MAAAPGVAGRWPSLRIAAGWIGAAAVRSCGAPPAAATMVLATALRQATEHVAASQGRVHFRWRRRLRGVEDRAASRRAPAPESLAEAVSAAGRTRHLLAAAPPRHPALIRRRAASPRRDTRPRRP